VELAVHFRRAVLNFAISIPERERKEGLRMRDRRASRMDGGAPKVTPPNFFSV
jgi:hypothetical protein